MSRQHSGDLALALLLVATGCGGVVGVPGQGAAAGADAGHDAPLQVEAGPGDAAAEAGAGGWWTPEAGPCGQPLDCSSYLDGLCLGGKCCLGFTDSEGGCYCGEYLGCAPGEHCCGDKKTGYLACRTDCFK